MSRRGVWRTLGIDATTDLSAIRRAYADRLRAMDPDADPASFAALRAAREQALSAARNGTVAPALDDVADDDAAPGVDADTGRPVALSAADTLLSPHLDLPPPERGVAAATFAGPLEPFHVMDGRPDSGTGQAIDLAIGGDAIVAPLVELAGGDITVRCDDAGARYDDAYRALYELLAAGGEDATWLTEEEEGEALSLVDRLLADPRLDALDFGPDAERWFADLLAGTIPRSDPLLDRVSERFGWTARIGDIEQWPAAERVATHARSLAYAAEASRKGHPDHKLWIRLSRSSTTPLWLARVTARHAMRDYIARVRRDYPDAEVFWDPVRVGTLEYIGSATNYRWVVVAIVVVQLLLAIGRNIPQNSAERMTPTSAVFATPSPLPLTNRDEDINLALLSFADGFTVDVVKAQNRPLYDALSARWDAADTNGLSIDAFRAQTRDWLVNERVPAAITRAPRDPIMAWRRMDLAMIDGIRPRGAAACVDYMTGKLDPSGLQTRDAADQRRRLLIMMLLANRAVDRPPPAAGATYSVPGEVMGRIAKRSGLGRPALSAALGGNGSDANQCAARRALIAVALDTPGAGGLDLLRSM